MRHCVAPSISASARVRRRWREWPVLRAVRWYLRAVARRRAWRYGGGGGDSGRGSGGGTCVLKRSADREWGTAVKWLSGLSLCVCVRTSFVGCLFQGPHFPSTALLK